MSKEISENFIVQEDEDWKQYLTFHTDGPYGTLLAQSESESERGVKTIELAFSKDEAMKVRDFINKCIERWPEPKIDLDKLEEQAFHGG